jgi:4-hydroxy-3-methylbut-2-enyl diphosphate reductase IspH
MKVLDADEMGFCFGVRDALAAARAESDPCGVTIHGELVHNEVVLAEWGSQPPAGHPPRCPAPRAYRHLA